MARIQSRVSRVDRFLDIPMKLGELLSNDVAY